VPLQVRFYYPRAVDAYDRKSPEATNTITFARSGRPTYELPLLVEKSWDKWTLYSETEYWLQTAPGQKNYRFVGAVLQHDITDRLNLGVELFGNTQKQSGTRPDVAFKIGGSFKCRRIVECHFR
jgi:hypothetical protein